MLGSAESLKTNPATLSVRLTSGPDEVEKALRLRYRVFAEEEQNPRLYNETGLERDEYDDVCDHLIVLNEESGEVVGTYRLLPGDRVDAKGFYSETEFDLTPMKPIQPHILELGRSCIAQEYRGSQVIQLLWKGIAQYLSERRFTYLVGCASLRAKGLRDLNELYSMLRWKQVITDRFGIRPLPPNRIAGLRMIEQDWDEKELLRRLPPLMKGYRWLGAEIAGEPAYDPVFDTVDFFVVLETSRVMKKYRRRFLST